MQDFWFYLKLGFHHVLDPTAYDHILFLIALAAPFGFRSWKKAIILATIFTVAHCLSLALAAYGLMEVSVSLVEFLIPVTILITALFSFFSTYGKFENQGMGILMASTIFFGLIHGFGFSNYFRMLMAEETEKTIPLLGFATGIEIAQVLIILFVLCLAYISQDVLGIKKKYFVRVLSILIFLITIPLAIKTALW
ncbi:HupE/UreJ family protein [Poritiphilus flavus]|uniref:HupE/UreJ family protein n=1 Tax=Poritiphilus flavus TaxID=2697053 RepID=A0A6L9E7S7_9FLAO|nr:HupE/UreJ family protein [Poritiphilus flavus]NAS10835.1 HupE/UreJ family protein [Poritiphilus flavus]